MGYFAITTVSMTWMTPLDSYTSAVVIAAVIPVPSSTRIPNPESRIPDPESRIPNPEPRFPNPESRLDHPCGFKRSQVTPSGTTASLCDNAIADA